MQRHSNNDNNDETDPWTEIKNLDTDLPPSICTFSEQPGPQMTLSANSSPLDFFSLFMDDIVLKMLVDGTNEYVRMVIDEKERTGTLKPNSRWRKCSHVTITEMRAVLAIIINMGILHCPEREGYWKTSWESYIPFFHDVLSWNRFEEIFWMLHIPEKVPLTNWIDKVSPLLVHLLVRFQSIYYPHHEISIDETVIGFKGQVSFIQYCPLKPTKWGLKAFLLADSETGYICNILPYIGQET